MPIFLIFAVLLGLVFTLLYVNREKPEVEELVDEWQVLAHNVAKKTARELVDTFPIVRNELNTLLMATMDELEDEAAGYACYAAYLLEHLDESAVLTVTSKTFGTFEFAPDFENGALVGVKLSRKTKP